MAPAARRQSVDREVVNQTSTKTDGRRVRRGTALDCGTTGIGSGGGVGGEVRSLPTARPRRRRRSVFPLSAEDNATMTGQQTSPRRRSHATLDNSAPHGGSGLSDQLRTSASRQPRRFSCTPSIHERFTPSSQTSSGTSVTDCSTTSTESPPPFLLQLQAKVKVSERPVRCLVNARYSRLNVWPSHVIVIG